ncbi:sulfate/molybdate ABC transporter ATP-binding protein [Dysosmobacter sp.]|uniref:sulfate/molybdate ABC transporter ATP-binding protein n=1 Tax=Dysosmobacter sp. TaxID=2591382 RepID=UPI003AB14206
MSLSVDIEKRMGDFHLEVRFEAEGETLALLGASGCGKSVTLKCVAGILTPDRGRITLDGVPLFDSAAKIDLPPQKRRVGYLFQQYALFPNMTVRQNIAAAVRDRRQRASVAADKLRQFQLEAVADLRPGQLSGGQQQRCALARILASEPGAILLDEPFSALDSYLKHQLELELWETLSAFPGPVIWVSHDRGEVLRNCPRVCVMDQGRSQAVRPMADLMARPGTEAAARLSGCENFADALPRDGGVYVPAWGVTLACESPVPEQVRRAGIRARSLRLAEAGTENAFACRVVRVVEDVNALTVLLRPEAAAADVLPIRMEADRETWTARAGETVTVAADPGGILPLEQQ